ncbi:DUF5895 domain-containing protein [Aetokthonos hydrillicola Thurmond2011]|jgi:hypothetical protein|uniref:DUF5895 domain-containing protein n=1 Tax=Aetokthonos hydrillicola Thurmond2011 TaxID=2712845 RepID=A0AAP5IAU9_9CYAN|nr:DUF5895 domain-containing protein [Aetokthonos hydrillicola]MBO3458457.1 hypothetical protein [Aetokthonos hydrillicola CCALA 1050]MBW4586216.1 hypothetical protein [Aetokthonos hydrillicola CCALA 1050]MDR9897824.1 DUF5895 domain-containing protein [Aetokthonos hydrillicola Thurmond2011]
MAKVQNQELNSTVVSQTHPQNEPTIPAQERDEFCSPEFLDPDAKLPRLQALRGTTPATCGYFVAVNQMAIAGWKDFDEKQLITYTFESSGAQEQGILIQNPRMLVCPKTPVLGYDRKQSQESNSTVILGRYTAQMREDENIGNLQYFQVFLLNKENQPLHQIPFIYKAAGANQATFAFHWQEFCNELNICHSIVNGIPAKQKNAMFYSLGVFCFRTARELVGTKQKSFACRVVDHERLTIENWRSYFMGFNKTAKEYVWESLEPAKPLMIPGFPETSALPATSE